jgi:squalene synthase HpnC
MAGVEHYENFPVASWLCPPALRAPIQAIYWFARVADDLADEGDTPPETRLADLLAYQAELHRTARGEPPAPRWARVFTPLAVALRTHALPMNLLDDLLRAFMQDVAHPSYANHEALLGYCRLSANPIGRLLLHLNGVNTSAALAQSDAICSALQLINFWQDLSVDLPRGRCYLPQDHLRHHGLTPLSDWGAQPAAARALVQSLCTQAHGLMCAGAPLVHALPGRAGWELRLVVQGGLRILEKIARMNHDTFHRRPTLGATDALPLLWRSLWMAGSQPVEGRLP